MDATLLVFIAVTTLLAVVAPTESVAVTVKLKVPAAVGVPLSTPALERVRPVGAEPAADLEPVEPLHPHVEDRDLRRPLQGHPRL